MALEDAWFFLKSGFADFGEGEEDIHSRLARLSAAGGIRIADKEQSDAMARDLIHGTDEAPSGEEMAVWRPRPEALMPDEEAEEKNRRWQAYKQREARDLANYRRRKRLEQEKLGEEMARDYMTPTQIRRKGRRIGTTRGGRR